MAQNNTQRGLEGFLNATDDELFRRQEKYGHAIYRTAWAVEILAALAGLFIAGMLAVQAYDVLPELDKDIWAIFRVVGGVLPFVIIAIIEPTKIFLASGLYYAKPIFWKMVFSFGLLVLTFVTFETIYNGLIQQNVNVNFEIESLQNDRSQIEEEIARKNTEITNYRQQTPKGISEKYDTRINKERDLYEGKRQTLVAAYQQRVIPIEKERKEIGQRIEKSRETINADIDVTKQDIDKETAYYDSRIKSKETEQNALGIFSGTKREKLNIEIDGEKAKKQKRINSLEKRLKTYEDKRDSRLDDDEATNRREELTKKKKELTDDRDGNLEAAKTRHESNVSPLRENKKRDIEAATSNRKEIPNLETQIKELEIKDSDIKAEYRKKASRLQVIQLSKMVCGTFYNWCFENTPNENNKAVKFDIADLPEEKVALISAIWFASIAAIVSTIGALLALTSFVLRDPKAYKTETNKTFRELVENIGVGFKNIGLGIKTLLERLAGGIGYALESIGGFFKITARSFRKLTLDMRRYLRTPKIKFEKIEVERIVEKIIEVHVEKTVIVHVPLFSTETGKVEVGEDFLGGWLDKNKQEKEG